MVDLGIPGLEDADLVGRGGFGQVYRARQPALNRTVAVKVLRVDEVTEDELRLFERECAAVGSLDWCSDIVSVYSTGTTPQGDPYMVMEYAPGGSLRDRLRAVGRLDEAEARNVAMHIGSALAHAHDAGLLHRDVKPANILISRTGQPILADFGIAKVLARTGSTSTSAMSGTLSYMAPEVLLDSPASPASDVYSLGATLFEALSGRTPFATGTNDTAATIMRRAIENTEVDLSVLVGVSDELVAALSRCLAVDVALRYTNAHELLSDLSGGAPTAELPDEHTVLRPIRPTVGPIPPGADDTRVRSRPDTVTAPVVTAPPTPGPPAAAAAVSPPSPPTTPPVVPPSRSGPSPALWAVMAVLAIVLVTGVALAAALLTGSEGVPAAAPPAPTTVVGNSTGSASPAASEPSTSRCWNGSVVEVGTVCSTNYNVDTVYWVFNFDPDDHACEQGGDDGAAQSYADDHCSFPPTNKKIHLGIYRNVDRRDQRLQDYGPCRVVDASKQVMRCDAGSDGRVALRYKSDEYLMYASAEVDRANELDFLLSRMRSLDEIRYGITTNP